MKKRIFAILMSAMMIVTFMPSMAFAKEKVTVKVTFYNGNTSVKSVDVELGAKVPNGQFPDVKNKGYDLSWYYMVSTVKTSFDDKVIVNTDTSVYADWTAKKYKLEFGEGEGAIKKDDVTVEDSVDFSSIAAPTKDGETFKGWKAPNGEVYKTGSVKFLNLLGENDDNKAPIKFTAEFYKAKITFDLNGHGTLQENPYYSKDGKIGDHIPKDEGAWAFKGWYQVETPDFDQKVEAATVLSGDVTVYAKWELDESKLVDISGKDVTIAESLSADRVYTGKEPTFTLTYKMSKPGPAPQEKPVAEDEYTLVAGQDYKITFTTTNTKNVGKVSGKIEGLKNGGFTGEVPFEFNITKATIAKSMVSAVTDTTFTGTAVVPTLTIKLGDVTLVKDVDYTIKAKSSDLDTNIDNINVSSTKNAQYEVTGIGNFEGSFTDTFKITPKDINDDDVVITIPAQVYTGSAITTLEGVSATYKTYALKEDTALIGHNGDYYLDKTENNIDVATATSTKAPTATFKGYGNFTGTKAVTFDIVQQNDLALCTISTPSKVYTGETIVPEVTVVNAKGETLKEGTDYRILPHANFKSIGYHYVFVEGKGKYTGTLKGTFKINPKKVTGVKLTGGKKQITVKWTKHTTKNKVTGYQVRYSTSKSFTSYKTVKVKGYKSVKKVVKSLKKNKKYYVKVRAYKTIDDVGTVYGSWSTAKSVKTKK